MTVQSVLPLEAFATTPCRKLLKVRRMGDGEGKREKSLRSVALTPNRKGATSNAERGV